MVSERQQGQVVSVFKNGTVTVTLDSAQSDGYSWRLSEIPDPTVLKLVSQDYVPPASGEGRGQEKWVFQTVGPGDVDVKMWYGNLRVAPLTGNPNFDFIASVSDETKAPEKKSKKSTKKA
ncbi:MAG: protease inhibitor I42 family protein [Chthoniobacter sp.]